MTNFSTKEEKSKMTINSNLDFVMTAETPVLTSPGSPNAQFRSLLSNKRDKRLSRNSRPPHSSDGIDMSNKAHSFGNLNEESQAGPSQPRSPTNSTSLSPNLHQQHLQHSHSLRENRILSPTHQKHSHQLHVVHSPPHHQHHHQQGSPPNMSPVRPSHAAGDDRRHSPHRSPNATTFLSLPLFADGERTRVSSSPMMPPPYSNNKTSSFLSTSGNSNRINRTQSMREPKRSSTIPLQDTEGNWQLPSHHQINGQRGSGEINHRTEKFRYASPSASMSLISDNVGQYDEENDEIVRDDQNIWSRGARRWSSSLPRGRNSTAFAFRLAEGASPYLRAGLEELRSIFDVDSNPIPSSPFPDEDDEDNEDEKQSQNHLRCEGSSDAEAASSSMSRETSVFSVEADRKLTTSPAAISSRDESPSRSSAQLRRTPSKEKSDDDRGGCASKEKGSSNENSKEHSRILMPFKRPLGLHLRSQSSLGFGLYNSLDSRQPIVNRRFLAWSLSFMVVGIIGLCAWGYATQSDAFSITLIGFFLTQPAFALAALISLIARKRALMDLFSRAMRAHVLAQALIVVFAYLDLSASSLYSASTTSIRGGHGNGMKSRIGETKPFPIVPTMEMRFGPLYKTKQAGDGPMMNAIGLGEITNSSIHAHDSSVGDWRSRLTYFVVFIVQAAAPIAMVLVGQYIIAQRLALLARHGSLSRQGSMRQQYNVHEKDGNSSNNNNNNAVSPITVQHSHLTSSKIRPTPLHRTIPQLNIPATSQSGSPTRRVTVQPTLNVPTESGFNGTHPRHRREERRKRLVTAPNVFVGTIENDSGQSSPLFPPPTPLSSTNGINGNMNQISSSLQESPIIDDNLRNTNGKPSMHRHRRSSSHPVNFMGSLPTSNLSQQVRTGTGLGMTFEEENRSFIPSTNSGLQIDL